MRKKEKRRKMKWRKRRRYNRRSTKIIYVGMGEIRSIWFQNEHFNIGKYPSEYRNFIETFNNYVDNVGKEKSRQQQQRELFTRYFKPIYFMRASTFVEDEQIEMFVPKEEEEERDKWEIYIQNNLKIKINFDKKVTKLIKRIRRLYDEIDFKCDIAADRLMRKGV